MDLKGSCLCGKVSIEIKDAKDSFDVCHCGMCRKWAGGPGFTIDGGGKATILGEEFISHYNSSDWAERGFCKVCGTHLFYRFKEGGFHNFSIGIFDYSSQLKFNSQIYTDSKPANYEFANKTEMYTEEEILKKFGL